MNRAREIVETFRMLIDEHLSDLETGSATEMYEIEKFADLMFMHPTHLSNIIKEVTGQSPCGVYQEKILIVAERLLSNPLYSIQNVSLILDFEPSHFSK